MTNSDRSKGNPADDLVRQDAGISNHQLEEFHASLNESLRGLEQAAHWSRVATIRSIVALAICWASGFLLQAAQDYLPLRHLVIPIWSVITLTVMITAGVLVGRHWYKHRPALERGRTDLQIAMFGELQRQLKELTERLERPAEP